MGLDMYLRAKRYISGYEFSGAEERSAYNDLVARFAIREQVDPHSPSAEVSFTVAYWRKANAIHAWFVSNVQDGKDECQSSYVSREQLTELRDVCQRVIDSIRVDDGRVHTATVWDRSGRRDEYRHGQVVINADVASGLLPTQSGFFFGSTDYSEGYIHDLHNTIEQIDSVLALPSEWELEYHASW